MPSILSKYLALLGLFLATQLFKLLDKYRPETKEAKKERLKARAEEKAKGKVSSRLNCNFLHIPYRKK